MKELSLHLLDIAENGITAGADRITISIQRREETRELLLRVEDNGNGMVPEELVKTGDPFFTTRTTRKVGLGIPLFRQHAEMTGGYLKIRSEKGSGTVLEALFFSDHPDIQPLGDIEGCWWLLAAANPGTDIILSFKTEKGEFTIGSLEVLNMLELEKLEGDELATQLKRLIRNNISEIGIKDEIIDQ